MPEPVTDGLGPSRVADEARLIRDVIAAGAARYLDASPRASVRVRLRGVQHRPGSSLYRFELGTDDRTAGVIVKVLRQRERGLEGGRQRPRLVPLSPADLKMQLEFRALSTVAAELEKRNDPRLRWIRPLDCLPELGAMVLEEAPGPNLATLARTALYLPSRRGAVTRAMEAAGAWLRAFQDMPFPDAVERRSTAADLSAQATEYIDWLEPRVGGESVAALSAPIVEALAAISGPPRLGVSHGDFAMRNLIVGGDHSVRAIDILGRWRTPVLEDVAYFLNALQLNRATGAGGLAYARNVLARGEDAFLIGYGEVSPRFMSELRAYQALLLLDRWAADVARRPARGRLRGIPGGRNDTVMSRLVTRTLREAAR